MSTTPEPRPRITGILDTALRGFQALPHDPLVRFINAETGATVITRDVAIYRRVAAWQERLFDRSSPVPRRT
jgi:hypothetical protein